MGYKLNPFTGKLDSVCTCATGGGGSFKYTTGADATSRSTKSTDYIWETNLILSLSVSANDIILVELEGLFNHQSGSQQTLAYIDVYSGTLTGISTNGVILCQGGPARCYYIANMYSSSSSQTVQFAMKWRSTNNRYNAYCSTRKMIAYVIGHT